MVRLLLLVIVALSLSLSACQKREDKAASDTVTPKEVREKVAEAMGTAADYTKQEKDEYVAQVQKEMDEAKNDLDRLRTKAKTATAKAKAELDRDIKIAEQKWKVAEQKFNDLKAASIESWKNLRAGVDKAVDDLKQFFSRSKKG